MTSRSNQRKIKTLNEGATKSELRRIRRGHARNRQADKGHGPRSYEPVMSSNTKAASKDVDRALTKVVKGIILGSQTDE